MATDREHAPTIELPGVKKGQVNQYSLTETTQQGRAVLLLFFPFDFSPVCVTELCAIRDAEWFELTPNLSVWAISGDSTYAHVAFADQYDLTFPLLSDTSGRVAESYGVLYDELEKHERVPKRAVILVDSDRMIRYKWVADNTRVKPDFVPVKAAVDTLSENDEIENSQFELDLSYGET